MHASDQPPLRGPVGRFAARVYGSIMARRNRRFDERRGVVEFDRPVISVGNLSVGGTGKTPMVAALVRHLMARGHRPCIAMRGYGSSRGVAGSDEAAAYRREFPAMPIVAQADRTAGLLQLFAKEHEAESAEPTDVIVLDDGFQHRRIARQMDVVLIDATRDPFADRLLPAGWLREPVESVRRATHVVLTHVEAVDENRVREYCDAIGRVRGRPVEAMAAHAWTELRVRERGAETTRAVESLRGQRVVAACAIGNPEAFLEMVRRAVGRAFESVVLPDHDTFADGTIRRVIELARGAGAAAIVCTDKDWSKLADRGIEWPCAVVRPRLEIAFVAGGERLLGDAAELARRGVP